jgi:hypothetical protein
MHSTEEDVSRYNVFNLYSEGSTFESRPAILTEGFRRFP